MRRIKQADKVSCSLSNIKYVKQVRKNSRGKKGSDDSRIFFSLSQVSFTVQLQPIVLLISSFLQGHNYYVLPFLMRISTLPIHYFVVKIFLNYFIPNFCFSDYYLLINSGRKFP